MNVRKLNISERPRSTCNFWQQEAPMQEPVTSLIRFLLACGRRKRSARPRQTLHPRRRCCGPARNTAVAKCGHLPMEAWRRSENCTAMGRTCIPGSVQRAGPEAADELVQPAAPSSSILGASVASG